MVRYRKLPDGRFEKVSAKAVRAPNPFSVVKPIIRSPSPEWWGYRQKSKIRGFAQSMIDEPTPAERRFSRLLYFLPGEVMRGRYHQQYPINGKWILDFYFPEVRLGIEIDGSVHASARQQALDRQKDADCLRMDITLVRFSNELVLGPREQLVRRFRQAWRQASSREHHTVGKPIVQKLPEL